MKPKDVPRCITESCTERQAKFFRMKAGDAGTINGLGGVQDNVVGHFITAERFSDYGFINSVFLSVPTQVPQDQPTRE
jgi:hypothetical protein